MTLPFGLKRLLPSLVFFLLSGIYFHEILFSGKLLSPVNPRTISPWSDSIPQDEKLEPTNALMLDTITLMVPWHEFNSEMFHRGRFPLWNPYAYCGVPHLAQIQPQSLDPLVIPFDWFDPIRGLGYSMAFHMALAGLLMYFFLRHAQFDTGPALIGGILFQFNGMFLVKMGNPTFINSAMWVPLLLWGANSIVQTLRWSSALPVIIGVFFSCVGGHPQLAALSYLFGFSFLIFRLIQERGTSMNNRQIFSAFKIFFLASLAGAGVAAAQLIPFLELMMQTSRLKISIESFRNSSLPLIAGIQAILPDIFGNPVDHNHWFREFSSYIKEPFPSDAIWTANYTEQNLYMGTAPILFAIYALWKKRTSFTLFFLISALVSLAIFFGSPLLTLAYYCVPAFGQSRPERVIYIYMISISVLTAIGTQAATENGIHRNENPFYRKTLLVSLIIFVLLLLYPLVTSPSLISGYLNWFPLAWGAIRDKVGNVQFQILMAVCILVVSFILVNVTQLKKLRRSVFFSIAAVLIIVPLFHFGWRFNPEQKAPLFPTTDLEKITIGNQQLSRIVRIMVRRGLRFFISNVPQTLGIHDANGASSVPVGDFTDFVRAFDEHGIRMDIHFFQFSERKLVSRSVLDYMNAEYILSDVSLDLPLIRTYRNGLFRVYRNPDFLQRFFLVNQVEFYRDKQNALKRLAEKKFDFSSVVLIHEGDISFPYPAADLKNNPVHVIKYDPSEVALEVETPVNSILVSSEVYYPGWKSFLDEKEVKTLRVNTAFRGVYVPSGRHRIRFEYSPGSFRYGLVVTAIFLVVVVVSWGISKKRITNQST